MLDHFGLLSTYLSVIKASHVQPISPFEDRVHLDICQSPRSVTNHLAQTWMSTSPGKCEVKSTGAVSLVEKPILLHNMQYFWHRASLSKVQYVLKCEILSECFVAPYNRALSFMATQSSFEKTAFVETWITFHWYMYLIYSNLIQFNPTQSNPIQIYLIYIIQSNPIKPKQIQSSPIQSYPIQSNPIYLI